MTVRGSGTRSANDLGTLLRKAGGIQLAYAPFGGTGSAIPALLGSHVTAMMTYSTMAPASSGPWPLPRRSGWISPRRADLQGTGT